MAYSRFFNKKDQDRFIDTLSPELIRGIPLPPEKAKSLYFVDHTFSYGSTADFADFAPDDLIAIQYPTCSTMYGVQYSKPVVTVAVCAFEQLRIGKVNIRYARIRRGNLQAGACNVNFTSCYAEIEWNQFTDTEGDRHAKAIRAYDRENRKNTSDSSYSGPWSSYTPNDSIFNYINDGEYLS